MAVKSKEKANVNKPGFSFKLATCCVCEANQYTCLRSQTQLINCTWTIYNMWQFLCLAGKNTHAHTKVTYYRGQMHSSTLTETWRQCQKANLLLEGKKGRK